MIGDSQDANENERLKREVGLTVLRGMDSKITDVVAQTTFVSVYRLDERHQQWSRADVEGFLYIVKRSVEPRYRLIILNQKNKKHLLENITSCWELNAEAHYIFYRVPIDPSTTSSPSRPEDRRVHGLWFFNDEERVSVLKVISSILGELIAPKLHQAKSAPSVECSEARMAVPEHVKQNNCQSETAASDIITDKSRSRLVSELGNSKSKNLRSNSSSDSNSTAYNSPVASIRNRRQSDDACRFANGHNPSSGAESLSATNQLPKRPKGHQAGDQILELLGFRQQSNHFSPKEDFMQLASYGSGTIQTDFDKTRSSLRLSVSDNIRYASNRHFSNPPAEFRSSASASGLSAKLDPSFLVPAEPPIVPAEGSSTDPLVGFGLFSSSKPPPFILGSKDVHADNFESHNGHSMAISNIRRPGSSMAGEMIYHCNHHELSNFDEVQTPPPRNDEGENDSCSSRRHLARQHIVRCVKTLPTFSSTAEECRTNTLAQDGRSSLLNATNDQHSDLRRREIQQTSPAMPTASKDLASGDEIMKILWALQNDARSASIFKSRQSKLGDETEVNETPHAAGSTTRQHVHCPNCQLHCPRELLRTTSYPNPVSHDARPSSQKEFCSSVRADSIVISRTEFVEALNCVLASPHLHNFLWRQIVRITAGGLEDTQNIHQSVGVSPLPPAKREVSGLCGVFCEMCAACNGQKKSRSDACDSS